MICDHINVVICVPIDLAAEQYLNELSFIIGSKWERLAIVLNLNKTAVDDIKVNNPRDAYNQCHAMLYQYFQANGSNFTKLVLAEALAKAGLLAIAESHHLIEIDKPDKSKERDHNNLQNEALPGKKNNLLIDFSYQK